MDKKLKKQLIIAGVIIVILAIPVALLSNPVLERFQARNTSLYERLIKKMENGKNVDKELKNLKFRQKLLGDIFFYTFREQKAIKTYEKYMDWFREEDWNTLEFLKIKYETALMYREVGQANASLQTEYYEKAGCNLLEITKWYERKKDYREILKKSRNALVQFDLKQKARNCREHPERIW